MQWCVSRRTIALDWDLQFTILLHLTSARLRPSTIRASADDYCAPFTNLIFYLGRSYCCSLRLRFIPRGGLSRCLVVVEEERMAGAGNKNPEDTLNGIGAVKANR